VSLKRTSTIAISGFLALLAIGALYQYANRESSSSGQPGLKSETESAGVKPSDIPGQKKTDSKTSTTTKPEAVAETQEPDKEENRERSEELKTADPNEEPDNALAGITYRDIQMWEREEHQLPEKLKGGVMISKIHAKSSAAEAQVRPGDIITHAHHTKVVTFTDLNNVVTGRTHTLLDVYRDGKPYQVVLNKPFRAKEGIQE